MKKFFALLLFIVPVFLAANFNKPPTYTRPILQNKSSPHGLTSKGTELVETVWNLVKHHKWSHLKSKMDDHYSGIDIFAQPTTRKQEIDFLKTLNVNSVHIVVKKVLFYGKNVLSVQYKLDLGLTDAPDLLFPSARMSVFQKIHGTWLWKSDADLTVFLAGAE